ncbi:Methyltransferase domain-containing protein [Mucilaginibacter lappiensis]|uniref:SAM-dependent methyltransferase n=1 Tax=Mucilaginibacter lappiensis TaxID=354630 RepID=A0ABR6PGS7_9SPHI|nr:class I SAM-dependent methyltransferase [Mucilaginibacter lappiensis]MBB6107416.1 SAM-dependent methyltransferase [Mucilaginibacter lappiensis]SIQ09361.1 Methyltransferase domain-containing protein [Mucilaginibacter lappiensis]
MKDILGQAIHDHYHQQQEHQLWINNQYGPSEEMPVEAYFREEDDMPDIEWLALNECRGDILDIGAGAGAHVLILQERGFDVTALDISNMASTVMKARGVHKVITANIFEYRDQQYDTLLLLMNGIGLTGTLLQLKTFLQHTKQLLKPGGQLLFDSSDIAYLYEGKLPENGVYYGEIQYQYQYNQQKTDWFPWLYIDEQTLTRIAEEIGYNIEVLLEDEFKQYLVRLTVK